MKIIVKLNVHIVVFKFVIKPVDNVSLSSVDSKEVSI